MARIIATALPNGITSASPHQAEREISTDLPADIIGECVAEATNKAWKAGFDPAKEPFVVLVTFR